MKRYSILLVLALGFLLVLGCEDDSNTDPEENVTDVWVGTWLSAGTNVAPILATYFLYDSVRVVFTENNTVTLATHVTDGAWTTIEGTFVLTESTDSDIDIIQLIYPAFEQEGIIEIIDNTLRLEAVQTTPDIAATVPTPAVGFGADATLGTMNIQTYIRQD